jgi:hypothetical protein
MGRNMPSPDVRAPQLQGMKAAVQLGLRANWQQFTLLVIVNAFVGAMVGLERSIVPLLGQQVFGLASTTAVLSFIMSFGIVKALAGLLLSLFFVRESHGHARHEAALLAQPAGQTETAAQQTTAVSADHRQAPSFKDIFLLTSWKNQTLFGVSQAGLVNNLNDGLAWGLFPLFFAAGGLSIAQIGLLAGVYPGVWGVAQLLTGALSDRLGRKGMIVGGMMLQGMAIGLLPLVHGFAWWIVAMVLLGLGTALVYPTLLAAISDVAHPSWRDWRVDLSFGCPGTSGHV